MSNEQTVIIGTRGSLLALAQTKALATTLGRLHRDLTIRLEIIQTRGDNEIDRSIAALGVAGVFTRELELALLERRIDLAVHSLKDVPNEQPTGLMLAPAVPEREDPRDCFVTAGGRRLTDLPRGAKVGTGSLRRRAQLATLRPDFVFQDLRGNIDTRLRKVGEGQVDAAVLAKAGLARAGLFTADMEVLDYDRMLPAPGQGALALEIRSDDARLAARLMALDHPPSRLAVRAERALLRHLEGGCQAPIGAWGRLSDADHLTLTAVVALPDGSKLIRDELTGSADDPDALGRALGQRLIDAGGSEIIAATRSVGRD